MAKCNASSQRRRNAPCYRNATQKEALVLASLRLQLKLTWRIKLQSSVMDQRMLFESYIGTLKSSLSLTEISFNYHLSF